MLRSHFGTCTGWWDPLLREMACNGSKIEVCGPRPHYLGGEWLQSCVLEAVYPPPPFNSKEILSLLKFLCFSCGSIKRSFLCFFLCFAILYFTLVFLPEFYVFPIPPFFRSCDSKGPLVRGKKCDVTSYI